MSREHEAYLEAQREDDERQRYETERDAEALQCLPADMRVVVGMLQMGERIEFGRDAYLLERGAAEIERLREKLDFALKWAEGMPFSAYDPYAHTVSVEDVNAFKKTIST